MQFQQVLYKKIKINLRALEEAGFTKEEVCGMLDWMGHKPNPDETIDLYIKAEISERKKIKYIAIGKPIERGESNAGNEMCKPNVQ